MYPGALKLLHELARPVSCQRAADAPATDGAHVAAAHFGVHLRGGAGEDDALASADDAAAEPSRTMSEKGECGVAGGVLAASPELRLRAAAAPAADEWGDVPLAPSSPCSSSAAGGDEGAASEAAPPADGDVCGGSEPVAYGDVSPEAPGDCRACDVVCVNDRLDSAGTLQARRRGGGVCGMCVCVCVEGGREAHQLPRRAVGWCRIPLCAPDSTEAAHTSHAAEHGCHSTSVAVRNGAVPPPPSMTQACICGCVRARHFVVVLIAVQASHLVTHARMAPCR